MQGSRQEESHVQRTGGVGFEKGGSSGGRRTVPGSAEELMASAGTRVPPRTALRGAVS